MRLHVRNHSLERSGLLLIRSQNAGLIGTAFVAHRRKSLLRILQIATHTHPNELCRNLKVRRHSSIRLQ